MTTVPLSVFTTYQVILLDSWQHVLESIENSTTTIATPEKLHLPFFRPNVTEDIVLSLLFGPRYPYRRIISKLMKSVVTWSPFITLDITLSLSLSIFLSPSHSLSFLSLTLSLALFSSLYLSSHPSILLSLHTYLLMSVLSLMKIFMILNFIFHHSRYVVVFFFVFIFYFVSTLDITRRAVSKFTQGRQTVVV